MGLRPLLGPPCIPPEAPPRPTLINCFLFRGRLRTHLADVSASVLYDAAPGDGHSLPEKQHRLECVACVTASEPHSARRRTLA